MAKDYPIPPAPSSYVAESPTTFYAGSLAIPLSEMTSFQKMQIIRNGISKKYLTVLKDEVNLDYDTLAHALSVTRATLINKKGLEKFSDQISERIVALADLYSFGYSIFEDKSRFNSWMSSPNQALGGAAPLELVNNQYGRDEVHSLIGRIAYGVYS